jgi:hypothetical protein
MPAGSKDKAVLLLKVNPGPLDYELNLSAFDPDTQTVQNTSFSGYANFHVNPKQPFVAQVVTPGTYAYMAFVQQTWWMACYQSSTLSFSVQPGDVIYLGEFNPIPAFAAIGSQAQAKGELTASSRDRHYYFENIPAPSVKLDPNDQQTLATVRDFVRTSMTKVQGTVHAADYKTAKFGNGFSLFGQPVCGGYFKKSAQ